MCETSLTCFFQFIFSYIITARYLADDYTAGSFFLNNFKFSFDILAFLFFLKRTTSVFVASKAILFAFSQKERSLKSLRVLLILSTEFGLSKIHQRNEIERT